MDKLFHIHKTIYGDKCFYEGAELLVGKNYNHMRNGFLHRSCSYTDYIEKDEETNQELYHRADLIDALDYDHIASLPKDKQISLLNDIREFVIGARVDFREIILEDIRREFHPEYPSRYNCIYLTDEKCVEYWLKALETTDGLYEIYEVEADGNFFIGASQLLPQLHHPHKDMYKQAMKYWEPQKEDLEVDKREYLFEGNVLLKRRVK